MGTMLLINVTSTGSELFKNVSIDNLE